MKAAILRMGREPLQHYGLNAARPRVAAAA